jgi:putative DNA primase/helicase
MSAADPVEAALSYAARGWLVFPCQPGAKTPITGRGLQDATTDPETIRAWWKRWPKANPAIRTGAESGLAVIDVDACKPGADEALPKLTLSPTRLNKTPRGGTHFFYRRPVPPSWRPGTELGR